MSFISPFERIWAASAQEMSAPDDLIFRGVISRRNDEEVGVMVLADAQPAFHDFHHMVIVAPSYGAHHDEQDMSDYPDDLRRAFNEVSDFFNGIMRAAADRQKDEVVKRLVSNNGIKNHPHGILYIASRERTLSERDVRYPMATPEAKLIMASVAKQLRLSSAQNTALTNRLRRVI